MTGKKIIIREYHTPYCGGILKLGSYGDKLCLCDWQTSKRDTIERRLKRILNVGFETGTSPIIERASAQLDEYFAGKRSNFDIPLMLVGTDFQIRVWNELLNIPYGKTVSYREIARLISMPKSVRAVANANGANAISIFIPCHRVIGSDGKLTGYGGGLNAKEFLLRHEVKKQPIDLTRYQL